MKNYYLKSRESGEVINKVSVDDCEFSLELAVEYFSKVKNLDSVSLLSIYDVDDKVI